MAEDATAGASVRVRATRRLAGTALIAVLLPLGCGRPESGGPRVEVDGETLAGALVERAPGVTVFKGVPYAAPPLGELRWRPPEAIEPRRGVQPAVAFGPACPQGDANVQHRRALAADFGADPGVVPDPGPTSEDCLYLNVWTSNLEGVEAHPVMIWIHGGSNVYGSGAELPYDGAELAQRGVVVVTLNYRLGILGFLAHPALTQESPERASGNYGLLDQIAALEWIQRNIGEFGGDPTRVTIFGQSSGAANALYLMTSPLAEGLFHRVISQSGSALVDQRTLVGEESRGPRLEELLDARGGDPVLAQLRAVPVERLVEVSPEYLNRELDCAPVADGRVVPDVPGRIFGLGEQHDVPLLIGSNQDEWTSIGRYAERVTVAGLQGWLSSAWGPWAARARALYQVETDAEVAAAVRRWQTDRWFTCPTRYAARAMARLSSPAFVYRFVRASPGSAGERLGAYHGAETAYVFDNLDAESWIPRDASDRELADAMADYWVAFARHGAPRADGRPEWPSFESGDYLELGAEIRVQSWRADEPCTLWTQRLEAELGLS